MNHPTSKIVSSPVIVALDFNNLLQCEALVDQLDPNDCRLKIGKEMFTLFGPQVIEILQHKGFEIFLDLKFHDIPATVAKAVAAAAQLGVWMVNVHASGGAKMMDAAVEALSSYRAKPLLLGVTVLTSMSTKDLEEVGVATPLSKHVAHLAAMAKRCGLDGVVCSALEAGNLKAENGKDFLMVTPGIRPEGADTNDQSRIMTPRNAISAGSDYLVIGRPITQAANPAKICQDIISELRA